MSVRNLLQMVVVVAVLASGWAARAGLVSVAGPGASCSEQILTGGSVTANMPGLPLLPAIDSGPFAASGTLAHSGVSVSSMTTLEITSLTIDGTVSTTYNDTNLANNITGWGESLIDFSFELDSPHQFSLFATASSLAPYLGNVVLELNGTGFTPGFGSSLSETGLLAAGTHTLFVRSTTPTIGGLTPAVLTTLDFQLSFTPAAVPEPSSWAMLGVAAALGWRRWRGGWGA